MPLSHFPFSPSTTSNVTWNTTATYAKPHDLDLLSYEISFSYDKSNHLGDNIIGIDGDKMKFSCNLILKNRIQPYELIMEMINDETKFELTVKISEILILKYFDVVFTEIENNLKFDETCSFKTLSVKFDYSKMTYENLKLDISEKRKDKLNKIKEYEDIKEE